MAGAAFLLWQGEAVVAINDGPMCDATCVFFQREY